MTGRQWVIRAIYPLLKAFSRWADKKNNVKTNEGMVPPAQSFYLLNTPANTGGEIVFETFRGKKVLLVNTASDCGYTPQYEGLRELSDRFRDRLVVIGFPANDFKGQEKGTDAEIAAFCSLNYAIAFPMARKSSVIPGMTQNPVFRWLSQKQENGWNSQAPTWNFSKYLVNEQGVLTHYFGPSVSPTGEAIRSAILH